MKITVSATVDIDEARLRSLAEELNKKVDVPFLPERAEQVAAQYLVDGVVNLVREELPGVGDSLNAIIGKYAALNVTVE